MSVAFTNPGKSVLRFQISDATYTYWCYQITGNVTSPVVIPLTSFNTKCWDNSGTAFVPGTPIQTFDIVIPGSNNQTTPFSFCFEGMGLK